MKNLSLNLYLVFAFFLLFSLSFSNFSFAQNTDKYSINGIVKDKNGENLIGATVLLNFNNSSFSKGTTTNLNGEFSLTNLSSELGEYTLKVSYIGYQTVEKTIDLNANTIIDIVLPDGKTLSEIVIKSYREYPVTLTEINKEELEKRNLGQDLPILLQYTPSVVSTSDAGAGVGYTGMRVRGSDATRTNVTVNGIPMNDAESQGTFWVNMPDFASSASSVQIQRGVGTSVNGAGAFGASVNISTKDPQDKAGAQINNSYGSFNTFRHNLQFNTGLLQDRIKFSGRFSKITSDGFIDKAFSDLKSFFVSGVYQNKVGTSIKMNIFGGQEQTFQAWNGVPQEILDKGNRTYNELAEYENETDNYKQDHYQLIFDQKINQNFTANVAFHYTKGRGYYEQYKKDQKFSSYKLEPIIINDSLTIKKTDLIRRRWLNNDFYGTVFNLNYESDATKANESVLSAIVGGGFNKYEGGHYGEIIWAKYASTSKIRQKYYDNDATKTDFNLFAKVNYQVIENLFAFADLQIRTINYDFLGFDNDLSNVEQTANLSFFNPKFGLTYKLDNHRFYGSWARANREPNRDDFTESTPSTRPKAERLDNVEIGWNGRFEKLNLSANYYLMNYTDQLILTGQVNDVGSYTRQNVDKSSRMGVEIVAAYTFNQKFSWSANATFSQNKINNFTEYVDDYDNGGQSEIKYGKTDIAFSPSLIAANTFSYKFISEPTNNFSINLLSKYVGQQFLDNTSTDTRKLDAYFVNDLQLVYNFSYKFFKDIELNLLVNNILSEEYESNGYTFGYISEGETTRQNYYFPQAGRNFLVGLKLSF